MDISGHPIWKNVKPYKKPLHLARIELAKQYAKLFPRALYVGITGSVGKTTTTQACKAVLSTKYACLSTTENLDPFFNIPITILKIRRSTKKVILEMGIEFLGDMDFYMSVVHPATAIITRIYYAHSEFLGGVEDILQEKGKVVQQLPENGFAILNWDCPYTRTLKDKTVAQVIFYGFDPNHCDVWASDVKLKNGKTFFEINYGVERIEVSMHLLGRHLVYPALAAAALGISCGLSLMNVKKGLEVLLPAPHRLQMLEGLNGSYILDDTYNSSPAALEGALDVLGEIEAKRRIAVLGEMKELGVFSEKLHRQIAQKIVRSKIDYVILGTGDACFIGDELIKLGFSADRLEVNLSNSQMVNQILKIAGKDDIVLVKASHSVRLDEVVKRISKNTKK